MSVYATRAVPRSLAAVLLLAAALLGFLSGHRSPAHPEPAQEVSFPGGSLNYPTSSSWRATSAAAAPPSLAISEEFALAPGGQSSRAALIVGLLPRGSAPLPAAFVAQMRTRPETQVVYLPNAEAYRYSGVELAGSSSALTLYTIPDATRRSTVIVCSARAAAAREMHECEAIAASLTRSIPEAGVELSPDRHTAQALRLAIAQFDRLRTSLRPRISTGVPVAEAQALALRLAAGATAAAESIARVPTPAAAANARTTLVQALEQTHGAYTALAEALARSSATEYGLARAGVTAAEQQVDAALASFALLGYDTG